ncbi:hypothetical protein GGI64_004113 [Rhizobium leguminosarum]|uniref:Uncharacterized protein n=1 Tax=Rhizobium leguminosarum TaxID=384 RepID=A0A7Z0E122_RHILE|nr:hypothetical protein [Rhizobium leguminosarum]NYJ13032.1 hypothetical protein [Rhizobium leguminosarum]
MALTQSRWHHDTPTMRPSSRSSFPRPYICRLTSVSFAIWPSVWPLEAQAAGVALGNINVPLQKTVPDGGEDGRIVWKDGVEYTDYLPGRDNFFQCKASNCGKDGWKKECWTKLSRRKGYKRILTPALKFIVAVTGHYIGFTTEALTGQKMHEYPATIGVLPASLGKRHMCRIFNGHEICSELRLVVAPECCSTYQTISVLIGRLQIYLRRLS